MQLLVVSGKNHSFPLPLLTPFFSSSLLFFLRNFKYRLCELNRLCKILAKPASMHFIVRMCPYVENVYHMFGLPQMLSKYEIIQFPVAFLHIWWVFIAYTARVGCVQRIFEFVTNKKKFNSIKFFQQHSIECQPCTIRMLKMRFVVTIGFFRVTTVNCSIILNNFFFQRT